MLKVTRKEYEIEEKVQGLDENDQVLYEFVMQITPEEKKEIDDLIFDSEQIKLSKQAAKAKNEELEDIEEKIEARVLENQERFENLCFKEHRNDFRQAVGEYKYLEMVETMYDFFWNAFVEKKKQRANTMISDLRKITNS